MQEIDDESSLLLEAFMFKQLSALATVVPIFVELIFEPKYLTLVTRFAGNSLDKFTQKRQFSIPTLASIFKQGIEILKKLMLVGVVHRDIKPQNMIYDDENDRLLFIDFGLA
jgi:serine/threonine protein kinase